MIDNVMTAKDGQWYSQLKRITNFGQNKSDLIQVDEISHMTDTEQAEAIADSFSEISNEYEPVDKSDIKIPPFNNSSVPQFKPYQIRKYLQGIKTNKSTAPGDIPARIIKDFSLFLCIPVSSIINSGLIQKRNNYSNSETISYKQGNDKQGNASSNRKSL